MAFRMQDLMVDVSPDKANPECTCQITVGAPAPPDTGGLDEYAPGGRGFFACNVCDSTPEDACPAVSAAYLLEGGRDGLPLLREQLRSRLARLN